MNSELRFETAKALSDDDLVEYIKRTASTLLEKKAAVTLRHILAQTGIFDPGSDLQVARLGVILAIASDIATIPYFERRLNEIRRLETLGESLGMDRKWVQRGVVVADEIQDVMERSFAS